MRQRSILKTNIDREDGSLSLEAILVFQFLILVLFSAHVGVTRQWRKKIEELQTKRIPFDGEKNGSIWKNH